MKDDYSILIAVKPDRSVVTYMQYSEPLPVDYPYWAWGSGRDFALGVLATGGDARTAVQIASQFEINCGLGVEAFDVHPLELVKTGD